jgi:glycosyltransferase 2 family protein
VKALQRSRAFFALTLVVGAVFAYLALRNVKFAETWDALKQSNYWWLIPSLALLIASTFLRALRWQLLFSQQRRPPLRAAWDANLVGLFFNSVLPARAGDAARVAALKKYAGTPMAESAATVAVERVFDVLSLLALLFISAPFLPYVSWLRAAAGLALVLGVALAVVICLIAFFGERPIHLILAPLRLFPRVGEEHINHAVENLAHGLAALREPWLGVANFVLTAATWIGVGLSFWLLMLGFDLQVSPLAGILTVVAVGLAMIVPAPPAAVGVFEAAGLAALSPYGVSGSRALAYVLVLHAVNIVPFTIAGLAVLARPKGGRSAGSLPALPTEGSNHLKT